MPKVITTENPSADVCRYLRRWTSVRIAQGEILARHPGLSKDRLRRKAHDVASLMEQGLELLEAARGSSVLTKPLPLFYATEAFAKALCIVVDRGLVATDFRAHGLTGDKGRRYFIRTLKCLVGAAGSDVWSRFLSLSNGEWYQMRAVVDGTGQVADRREKYGTPTLSRNQPLSLGELLRHLPELAEEVSLAGWKHPYVVHLSEYLVTSWAGTPPGFSVKIVFRHAHNPDVKEMVREHEHGNGVLRSFTLLRDEFDVLAYQTTTTRTSLPSPRFRCDLFGELYGDLYRGRVVLSEQLVYFVALFILSDVVRYQAGQWQDLLEERPEEAVLIERFLDLATRKVPNLFLNELGGSLYLFRASR